MNKENSPAAVADIASTEFSVMWKRASDPDRWLIRIRRIVKTLGVDIDVGSSAPEVKTAEASATKSVNKTSTGECHTELKKVADMEVEVAATIN